MEPTSTGPLIPRRLLGTAFRELRESRGETLQQAADACLFSPSKLSRIENGLAGEPHPRDVRDLLAHFEVPAGRAAEIEHLAEAGRVPGWWQVPPYDMPSRLDTFISYESAASSIEAYVPGVVPGLLQTAAYAREVLSRVSPWLDPAAVALQVDIRMTRQAAYRRRDPAPRARYAVPETILHRMAGSAAVMREQLNKLVEAFDDPLIDLHVIPFSAGLYEAVEQSSTTIFSFDDDPDLDVVAIERSRTIQFLDKNESVRHYRDVIARLADLWLDRADSRSFITDIQHRIW